jgi:uncharacterized protein YkwD
VTRFPRRATTLAAVLLAAPLGFTLTATAATAAPAAAREVADGWINSPGHKANILNCGSVAVGVGLAYKADGTPYWTQDFGRV